MREEFAHARLGRDCLVLVIGDERCDPHKIEVLGWYAWRDGHCEATVKKAVAGAPHGPLDHERRAGRDIPKPSRFGPVT